MRARVVTTGTDLILKTVRNHSAQLVLYASDASENTKKQITDKCHFYNVRAIEVEDSVLLSQCIGKSGRMAVAISSEGFAKRLIEKLEEV